MYNHHFLIVFHTFLFFYYWLIKKWFINNPLKSLYQFFLKEPHVGSSLPFVNESTNNLLMFLKVGSIRKSKLLLFGSGIIPILFLRNCSFKSLLPIFQTFHIIINRQSNNWDMKFRASNHEICSSYCIILFHLSSINQILFYSWSIANQEISKTY